MHPYGGDLRYHPLYFVIFGLGDLKEKNEEEEEGIRNFYNIPIIRFNI